MRRAFPVRERWVMTSWDALGRHLHSQGCTAFESLDHSRHGAARSGARDRVRGKAFRARNVDLVLLGTAFAAGVIRFVGLGSQSMWFDEVSTTHVISGGMTGLWGRVRDLEGTPPLYYALASLWTHLCGSGDAAIRSLSAVAGTATVPIVYLIARELGQDRRVARIAALLIAVHPFLVWYSQEARPYALLVFFGSVSLLGLTRTLRRGDTFGFLLFGLASAAALATHYFAIFLIAPEVIVLVVARARHWRQLLLGLVPVACTGLTLYPLAAHQQSLNKQRWIRFYRLRFRESEAARHFLVGLGVERPAMWRIVAIVVLVAAGLLVVRADRSQRRAAALMLLLGTAAVLVPVTLIADYFLDRNAIVALVPLILAVAIGLGARRGGWVGPAATLCAAAVCLVAIIQVARDPLLQRTDWHSIARVVERQPRDRVVVMNGYPSAGLAMLRYFPDARVLAPNDTVNVQEVDVLNQVTSSRRCDLWYGRPCFLRFLGQPLPSEYASHFREAQPSRVQDLRVDRYVSAVPVSVQAHRLVKSLLPSAWLVVFAPES
jgi:mannosyltransferase